MHETSPAPLPSYAMRDLHAARAPEGSAFFHMISWDMTSHASSSASTPPPPPPPDPVYTFRPYAGEVTAVEYVTLPGRQPAIASG